MWGKIPAPCRDANKRGYSLSEENTPFRSPRERRGASPSTPALAVGRLKSCAACGVIVLAVFVSIRFGLLLSSLPLCLRIVSLTQSPSTLDFIGLAGAYQGGIASLAAAGTTENTCTVDRRKLGCTCARSAERHPQGVCRIRKAAKLPTAAQQRVVGVGQIVSHPQWRRAKQCRHAGTSIPQAPHSFKLQAANANLSLGGQRGIFSFTKENIPLISHPHTVWGKIMYQRRRAEKFRFPDR